MAKVLVIALGVFLSTAHVYASTASVKYTDGQGQCDCSAILDLGKASVDEFKNAIFYLDVNNRLVFPKITVWEKVPSMSRKELETIITDFKRDIKKKISLIESAPLPKGPKWIKFRQDLKEDIEFDDYSRSTQLNYFANGSADGFYEPFLGRQVPHECSRFIDFMQKKPLSKVELLATKKALCKENVDPQCQKKMSDTREGKVSNLTLNIPITWSNCVARVWKLSEISSSITSDASRELETYLKNKSCTCANEGSND